MGTSYAFAAYQRNLVWKTEFALWTDVVPKSPSNARAQGNLGFAFAELESYDKAIPYYSKALRIKPDDWNVHNNMGAALLVLGNIDKAIRHIQRSIELAPKKVSPHYNLGIAYGTVGNTEMAFKEMRLAKRLGPDKFKSLISNRIKQRKQSAVHQP